MRQVGSYFTNAFEFKPVDAALQCRGAIRPGAYNSGQGGVLAAGCTGYATGIWSFTDNAGERVRKRTLLARTAQPCHFL